MEMANGTLIRVTDADIKNGMFSFPEGVEKIGNGAFYDCTSLQSIIIPKGVKKIGGWAFWGCRSLQSISISESVEKIGDKAFLGCMNLQSITLAEGVKTIGDWAFESCKSLQSITLPKGVKTIDNWAFVDCTSLQSIALTESVKKIGSRAFQGCTSLQSIAIPEGAKKIDGEAFSGCTSLQSISIPESVEKIGDKAFSGCTSLSSICISSTTAAGHERIVDLLPEELRSRVVPHEFMIKLRDVQHRELHRIVQTAHTNPMGRTAKSGMPIPGDVLKEINGFLGEDNRFLRKAKRQIAKLPLPADDKGFADYTKKVHAIVDEAIAHSKRGIAPPVMPEVLRHLKRLEDKASDLSSEGEEEVATTLRGLCAELKQHHNALVSGRLDAHVFQEKCKQAIEQKYEVLGGHRGATRVFNPLQNFFKSDPAFLKTDTIKLLDALIETIEQKAPNQSPSQSSC